MITSYMTHVEARDEVLKDFPDAFKFSDTKDAKFKRRVLKASVFPVRAHAEYVSKRRNKWLILFEARSKKNVGDLAIIHFVCYANTQAGYYAYFPLSVKEDRIEQFLIFPPHFFQRYAEREGVDKTGVELMRHYFERNHTYFIYRILKDGQTKQDIVTEEEINSGELDMKCVTEEGIALGNLLAKDVYIFKTFISWDDTFEDQRETFFPTVGMIDEVKQAEDEMCATGYFNKYLR